MSENVDTVKHRIWLPQNHSALKAWLKKRIDQVNHQPITTHPVIQEFQNLIERDAQIYMGFNQMFEQIPTKPPYNNDPTGKPQESQNHQVRDYKLMLALFNLILGEAPCFEDNDFIGFPINAILDWPMSTAAGITTFINPTVNSQFKRMFDVWASFLESHDSCYVLSTEENGWFGPKAKEAMPGFTELFICDPSAPYYGFSSWDDFFTRRFRPHVRPVAMPDDNAFVNSACESIIYRIEKDVKARDNFWLKGEPYSLQHMLNNDPLFPEFVGGTVYQAFLNAMSYHRWHSPVNGKVSKIVKVPGTYYAESPAMGFANPDGPDPVACMRSQAFITNIATRIMIFIEADNPSIGLMCFMAVGMAEVSTCEETVKVGDVIKKGDQLGMFHFGGSTHCLIFRKQTNLVFTHPVETAVLLNAAIAMVEGENALQNGWR